MRAGILGGTFDPVHVGHLALAETALVQLRLEKVFFVPAGDPWMKTAKREVTPAKHRLAMLRLALRHSPQFEVSTVDLERPGKTYAVDTVSGIKRTLPKWSRLYFILGADSLQELPLWRSPTRLIRMCRLAVAPRPGAPFPNLAEVEREVPGISRRVVFLDMRPVNVSSSVVRGRLKEGRSIGDMVPGVVREYIKRHGLYLER